MGKGSIKRSRTSQSINNPISILVPVYNGSDVLKAALESIKMQSFTNFEVVIGDDNKPENTEEIAKTLRIIEEFHASVLEMSGFPISKIQIRYIKNKVNLGCHKNFENLVKNAKHDIVLFLAQDDIFSVNALQIVHDAFIEFPKAGVITRPYFWFESDIEKPIRYVPPIDLNKNTELSIFDGEYAIKAIFGSVGQISGLAMRKSWITILYHTDIFPGHIYPIAEMLKEHTIIFLKDYIVAVGTFNSQSRHISSIYDESPTEQWMRMFYTMYGDPKYEKILKQCITHMATNYEGLIQIKNFGKQGMAEKEIAVLLKYRWQNIRAVKFWFYSLITVITPRFILRHMTDWYKRNILSQTIPHIQFEYKNEA